MAASSSAARRQLEPCLKCFRDAHCPLTAPDRDGKTHSSYFPSRLDSSESFVPSLVENFSCSQYS